MPLHCFKYKLNHLFEWFAFVVLYMDVKLSHLFFPHISTYRTLHKIPVSKSVLVILDIYIDIDRTKDI